MLFFNCFVCLFFVFLQACYGVLTNTEVREAIDTRQFFGSCAVIFVVDGKELMRNPEVKWTSKCHATVSRKGVLLLMRKFSKWNLYSGVKAFFCTEQMICALNSLLNPASGGKFLSIVLAKQQQGKRKEIAKFKKKLKRTREVLIIVSLLAYNL